MTRFLFLLWGATVILFSTPASAQTITFAVLAKRGKEATIKRWQPLVDYLSLFTPYTIKLEPLSFEELKAAVRNRKVDLVLANPAMYVEFEACCGLSPIVTMKNIKFGKTYTRFGGVIFTRADRKDGQDILDLNPKTHPPLKPFLVGAVNPESFGGWLMQWREFQQAGLKRGDDFQVRFYGTHDAVVMAVLRGEVDVGCVRTDTLETMAKEGKIRLKDFRIIHPRRHPGFDLWISTDLYPEWPLARAPTLEDEVAERLASVLLALPSTSTVATLSGAAWTIPHNYQPVHECLRELGVGPYAELKAQILKEVHRKYLKLILGLLGLILLAGLVVCYIYSLNKRLSRAYRELERHRLHLEDLVRERTAHLERLTQKLREEIEERHQAERLASEEKERLAVILRSLADAVIVTDTSGRIRLLNPAAEHLLELTSQEVSGRPFCRIVDLEPAEETCSEAMDWSVLQKRLVSFKEARLKLPSGKELLVEGTVAPVHTEHSEVLGSVIVLRDVTSRKRLEEEALRASKLEALSLLASGVAHDFNNLLAAIVGYLNVLRLRAKDPGLEEIIDKAERACFTARTLTRELLTHTTGGGPLKRLVSVGDCLRENLDLALSGSRIKSELSLPPDLWPVELDADQMSICLHNIFLNARQAMTEGAQLFVRVRNRTLEASNPFGLPSGPYVEIEIEDTGPGIPKDVLPRLFEPFFTTKEGGSGLGLFTCQRIIEAHGGKILAEARPGKGALFRIFLPAKPEAVPPKLPAEETKQEIRTARVLIMDDEEGVRESMAEILQLHGFEVATAANGEEALKRFEEALQKGLPFQVVILDLTVPGGLGGKEILPKLKDLDPQVKAIVASGYSQDPVMENFSSFGFDGALLKPFEVSALLQILTEVLKDRPHF